MNEIRIASSTYTRINPKGLEQTITEFKTSAGKLGTEIVTALDRETKGTRIIERDIVGTPERVIDTVGNRHEVYVNAYPERPCGVFQYNEDNVKSYFPNINWNDLCSY